MNVWLFLLFRASRPPSSRSRNSNAAVTTPHNTAPTASSITPTTDAANEPELAIRNDGYTTTINMAYTIFGGTAPLMATWLISTTGSNLSSAFYLIAVAALLADVLAGGRHVRTRRKALNELVASREWGDGHPTPDRPQY